MNIMVFRNTSRYIVVGMVLLLMLTLFSTEAFAEIPGDKCTLTSVTVGMSGEQGADPRDYTSNGNDSVTFPLEWESMEILSLAYVYDDLTTHSETHSLKIEYSYDDSLYQELTASVEAFNPGEKTLDSINVEGEDAVYLRFSLVKIGTGSTPSGTSLSIRLVRELPPAPPDAEEKTVYSNFPRYSGFGTISATIDADRDTFTGLLRDDKLVDPADYTVTSGSTIITLSESHLAALKPGTHEYRALFGDDYADLILVKEAAGSDDNENLIVLKDFPKYTGTGVVSAAIDAHPDAFLELLLSDSVVDESEYTVDEGSTIITLSEKHLKGLAVGTYKYTAVFTYGFADLTLVVEDAGQSPGGEPTDDGTSSGNNGDRSGQKSVATGDSMQIGLWVLLLAIATLAILLIVSKKKSIQK